MSSRFWARGSYGRDERREDGDEHEDRDEPEADERSRIAAQPRPRVFPEPALALEREPDRLELRDTHETRIRGLMIAYEMSTTRFTSTNTIATKRMPPWSTG